MECCQAYFNNATASLDTSRGEREALNRMGLSICDPGSGSQQGLAFSFLPSLIAQFDKDKLFYMC